MQITGMNSVGQMIPVAVTDDGELKVTTTVQDDVVNPVGVDAIIYEETTTPLAANATFISPARDCSGVSTGTPFRSKYAAMYKVTAYQDVTFTLALEVSNDNTVWYRISSQAATSLGSGNFSSAFVYAPSFRYTRTVLINGAAPSTRTAMSVIMKSL